MFRAADTLCEPLWGGGGSSCHPRCSANDYVTELNLRGRNNAWTNNYLQNPSFRLKIPQQLTPFRIRLLRAVLYPRQKASPVKYKLFSIDSDPIRFNILLLLGQIPLALPIVFYN